MRRLSLWSEAYTMNIVERALEQSLVTKLQDLKYGY